MNNHDKILLAIEGFTGKFVNAIIGEANGYAFRILEKGEWIWKWAEYSFVNEQAGLGSIKSNLL